LRIGQTTAERDSIRENKTVFHVDSVINKIPDIYAARVEIVIMEDIENCLTLAEELVDAFQFEEARKHTLKVLETQPDNTRALTLHAAISIELGDIPTGRSCLQKVIAKSSSPDPYLALAQLSFGKEALDLYMSGIAIFQANLATLTEDDRVAASSAMCAVAELFMTDLCDEEGAEGKCEEALGHAKTVCPGNPEVHRVECDLRLVQQRGQEANEAMQKCLAAWAEAEDGGKAKMSFEFRASVAKLLIEMGQFEDGETILEQLIDEDDEAYLPWYLLGIACVFKCEAAASGGANGDNVEELETAREALDMARHLLMREAEGERDEELLASIDEFLQDLPPKPVDDDDQDDEGQ
jgi:tetratricopeptide (TPR) repeat protein